MTPDSEFNKLMSVARMRCGFNLSIIALTVTPTLLQQLLGQIDMDTREWSDGVLTNAARQVVREPIDIQSWIVCDGDIDPEWIESLNSVLDDNRLLTMPSGERIQFGPNVNFLFESHDLSCASPATISRMGMIFLRLASCFSVEFDVRYFITRVCSINYCIVSCIIRQSIELRLQLFQCFALEFGVLIYCNRVK